MSMLMAKRYESICISDFMSGAKSFRYYSQRIFKVIPQVIKEFKINNFYLLQIQFQNLIASCRHLETLSITHSIIESPNPIFPCVNYSLKTLNLIG
mmetsp:Transcript_24053/g.21366  ORF Transcript_24053/g.21366 Transcript_24053/m.21366 type:complete len:96 (+) Transcript_24053:269-556(+)